MPHRPATPFDLAAAGFRAAHLWIEAGGVVAMRAMDGAGLWNTPFDEHWRMVAEKHAAFLDASSRMMQAAADGHAPLRLWEAGIAPLDAATTDNRQRLAARGLRKPGL